MARIGIGSNSSATPWRLRHCKDTPEWTIPHFSAQPIAHPNFLVDGVYWDDRPSTHHPYFCNAQDLCVTGVAKGVMV